MRGKNRGLIISLNNANVERSFVILSLGTAIVFILIGFLFASPSSRGLSSEQVGKISATMSSSVLARAMSYEIPYFQASPQDELSQRKLSSFAFQLVTGINAGDPRTFIGDELPGFSLFDTDVLVAGKGVGLADLPIESPPPPQALQDDSPPDNSPPTITTNGKKVIFIYNTHDRESFLPELPKDEVQNNPDLAMSAKINVTYISKHLAAQLEKEGIGTQVSTIDYVKILKEKNLSYSLSYAQSIQTIREAMATNHNLTYFIDIHRDSLRRNSTTTTIRGQTYARVNFVIGMRNKNWEENEQFAKQINDKLENQYPGLSKGIFGKKYGNAEYNQSVSPHAILIEVGGVDNTMEECYRTADALAKVIAEVYLNAEKVNTKGKAKTA
ncbi:stage II sporulation protein P [Aneurinibacillus terranovensis]|uniref:stage II sporulation protein P n=1 Tax=Aneurinibacillus terranovensis TaxID=278991 RepID=UPI0004166CC5|nr:stage II sporulation protein P [Aneurinibacillus terranovensis]